MKDLDELIKKRIITNIDDDSIEYKLGYRAASIEIVKDLKHLKESQSKSSGEVKGWMCSKCMSVHTDKQPNENISFVCDKCVDRI